MIRTHYCNQLSKKEVGKTVCLAGWVYRRRDHGKLIFIDLRDRTGIVQIVFNPKQAREVYEQADKVIARIEGK